jgi:hypothetical protein
MWLRTNTVPKWYVHEIRGACYISWVSSADKANALVFSENSVKKWAETLSEMTGFDLEIVKPFE